MFSFRVLVLMIPPLAAAIIALNTFHFPLYDCPTRSELRCVSARFSSSRLSSQDNGQVRPLVIATQRDAVTVSCDPSQAPFTLRDASISIDWSRYIPLPTATLRSSNCIAGLPFIGLGALSRTWTDFVLSPNEMIMNPQSNVTFCQSGERPEVYFHSSSDRTWSVRSEIRIGNRNDNTEEMIELRLDSALSDTWLNSAKYDELIDAILRQGFLVIDVPDRNSGGMRSIVDNCRGPLAGRRQLPTITLIIHDPMVRRPVTELQIGPDDYLTEDCRLTINASPFGDTSGIIGDNILKNLSIHFRAESRTIGVCDPIE